MRALVISDTHFGAWTGRDLLREEFFLERLAELRERGVGGADDDGSLPSKEHFAEVVRNLGWGGRGDKIVFAHTHQPLADVRCAGNGRNRYWNTGSWIYQPDLGSRQAYGRYLRCAWPGTAVLIDADEPQPRLLEMLADLNPLHGGPGLPPP
jgi:hypothetical protein